MPHLCFSARRVVALLAAIGLLSGFGLVSCDHGTPPALERSFNKISYAHLSPDDEGLTLTLIELIQNAERTIDIALSRLQDDRVASALVAAKNRGVTVRVVTDMASMEDSGFLKLQQAKIAITAGDGDVRYLPDPTLTSILQACFDTATYRECTRRDGGPAQPDDGLMFRPDRYNAMTSNFAVVDATELWVSATPLIQGETLSLGWTASSQDLGIAFSREFQQMAGGVFATTLDLFNGPVKSTAHGMLYDSRIPDATPERRLQLQPGYMTNKGLVELQFNPQQRLVKEMIDEIYSARASVFLMTDEMLHDFAIDALLYKASTGFTVEVIVREGSVLPRELVEAGVVRVISEVEYLPTVMITDALKDRNGTQWARKAMVMSHQMYRAAPFEVVAPDPSSGQTSDSVRIYPSDFFVDGTLWTMHEFRGFGGQDPDDPKSEVNEEIDLMVARFKDAWEERAVAVP